MPHRLLARLRAALSPARHDRELTEELATHASLLEDELRQQGHSPAEARRRARASLGNTAALRDSHADTRGLPWLENLWRDSRFALRSLRRDAGFTVFALLTCALGIGLSTAIFSIVNTMLLRPLPVRDSSALVWIAKFNPGQPGDRSSETIPVNPFLEYRAQNRSFSDMAAFFAFYEPGGSKLTGDGNPERLTAVPISDNFLRVLGVSPLAGRHMTPAECQANLPVVLLTESFWRRRFNADPHILGRTLTLNNRAVTVIGIAPVDFGSLFAPGIRVDLFTPLPLTAAVNRFGNTLSMVGRLRPNLSLREAQAEADVIAPPIGLRNNRAAFRLAMMPFEDRVRGQIRPALILLSAAALVVMLVLCANVAHLQLARAAARAHEVSIRVALGAGRGRLIQQLITENLLLFSASAVFGLALASLLTRLLARLPSLHLPFQDAVSLDLTAFAFSVAIALAAGVFCGLTPALHLPTALHDTLKDSARGLSANRRERFLRSAFVVAEVALACVLLAGAGLLLRSLQKVLTVNMGFQPENAVAVQIEPTGPRGPARAAYFDDLLSRVRALPGITAAGVTDALPLGGNRSWTVGAKDQTYSPAQPPPDTFIRVVTDGYVTAMGIPVVAGRDLDPRDREGSALVVLINESYARALWPGQNPLGKFLRGIGGRDHQVVGVVADVRHLAPEQPSGNELYVPIRQSNDYGNIQLVVRSSASPAAALASVREALRPLEPNLPTNAHRFLADAVDDSLATRRLTTAILTTFAGFTLLLAALGIFGLISYSVTQRRQEIGIRMALGATSLRIQTAILHETLLLAALGLIPGIAVSLAASRALGALLYGIEPTDPLTLAGVCAVLALVAFLAGYLPSLRASRLDPGLTLRAE